MTRLSPGLLAAYHDTIYRVHTSPIIDKRIGHRNEEIERLMRRYRVRTACVLTAENPGSRQQPELVNRIRTRRLESMIAARGLTSLPTSAIDLDGLWPAERGRLVLGISLAAAYKLAHRFGQNAFLWVAFGQPTELKLCR
ncbi:MAG: DUF3293 domain-containing protein [Pseudomonadota bacterium]